MPRQPLELSSQISPILNPPEKMSPILATDLPPFILAQNNRKALLSQTNKFWSYLEKVSRKKLKNSLPEKRKTVPEVERFG